MTTSLPARPSLENLKKQAKTLLKSHNSGDVGVCAVLRRLNCFTNLSDQEILSSKLTLAQAQYALAMDYGFASWNALKEAVIVKHDQSRFLHLQCGDVSAESLRRSGVPGVVRVWYDAFCEGAVPDVPVDDSWFKLRSDTFIDWFDNPENAAASFRNMYNQLNEYTDYEEVILWFDACLYDQTILIHHLDWFSHRDMGDTKLSLICIGEYPGMPKFKGLGELKPDQMASLLDTRHEVTKHELDLGAQAWKAYRSDDPTAIEDFLSQDTSALPYIASALKRHLQRFPSVRNGLGREQQEALEVITQGYHKFGDIFWHVSDMEDPPYFGDIMLFNRLEPLAHGSSPLIKIEGLENIQNRNKAWPVDKLSMYLTDTGRDVLDGKSDWIEINGIDQWFGGVHLLGAKSVWRWDEANEKLVNRPA
ncbi:DUF1835 domain-containing protein [bacterium]|nr:DUF1835 domain-containing protein [bacterium]